MEFVVNALTEKGVGYIEQDDFAAASFRRARGLAYRFRTQRKPIWPWRSLAKHILV